MDNTIFAGPGFEVAGSRGRYIQADGPTTWVANANITPQMAKGLDPGHTIAAQKITALLNYSAAPATVAFTDAQLCSFLNGMLPGLVGQSAVGAIVSDGVVIGGGDVTRLNRVCLRTQGSGSLEVANGSIAIGATGTLEIEILIPHANPITGLDYAPDSGVIGSRSWQLTLGAAAVSLGSASLTITSGVFYTGNVVILGRPGARKNLRYKSVLQSDAVDSLEPATRVGHLVVGSTARTYADAISDRAANPTANPFSITYAGRNPFNDQGYLNNALVWTAFNAKNDGGAFPMPGADRGANGPLSHAMTPFYVWNGRAPGDTISGPIVINNAANVAATSRSHHTVDLVG